MKKFFFPLFSGLFFGAALQLGRVHEPFFIRNQMTMQSFVMLKMFLAAATTSLTVIALLFQFGSKDIKNTIQQSSNRMLREFCRSFYTVCFGAFLLGVGMTVTGSCPGTVYAQIGTGSSSAWLVFLGGILASVFLHVIETVFPSAKKLLNNSSSSGSPSLASFVETPRVVVALSMAACFASIAVAAEMLRPWQEDLKPLISDAHFRSLPAAFPPLASGVIIGLLQLPLVIGAGTHLGSSGSFACLCSFAAPFSSLLKSLRSSLSMMQVVTMLGVTLGSFLSSSYFQVPFYSGSLVTNGEAFFGGFVLVLGARLASGCTSGHGLSGVGYLSLYSLAAVVFMFSGAMVTGFLFYL